MSEVNGLTIPVLGDTGAIIDVICRRYITPERFTEEHVWIKQGFEARMTCLPIAEIDIVCEMGTIERKAILLTAS